MLIPERGGAGTRKSPPSTYSPTPFIHHYLRLLCISRWNPMMPDYRSSLLEEGGEARTRIKAVEHQGEVSLVRCSSNRSVRRAIYDSLKKFMTFTRRYTLHVTRVCI